MIAKTVFWTSLIVILYTYLGYPLVLKLLTWVRPKGNGTYKRPGAMPQIALLIPAYNEESVIAEKIENSLSLDYESSKMEIVVASDGSQDETNQIVRRFKDDRVKLLDYPDRQGKANVLNKSIPQTSAEIIVLSDANTMYQRDALKKLVRHFGYPEVGCVCGELKLVNPENSQDGDCERFYWSYEKILKRMEGTIGTVLGANGAIHAIRKDLFEPLPADTIIDDFILSMKIADRGYRIVYEPEAVGVEETQDLKEEFRRRVRIGVGNFQSIKQLRSFLNPLKGLIAFSFWSHKLFRWMVPFFLISLMVSNVFALKTPFFKVALACQICFYAFALLGGFKQMKKIGFPMIQFMHYFVALNTALFFGFLKFALGVVSPMWTPTNRNSSNHGGLQTLVPPKSG